MRDSMIGNASHILEAEGIEAVATAAGERKAGATIAVVQRAITRLAEGASVEQAMPTAAHGASQHPCIQARLG
jgi:hypothetical protein